MIDSIISSVWGQVTDYFSISPWWGYLFTGIILILLLAVISWYFEKLRSAAGVVTAIIIAMLAAYRKGETDAEKREAARKKRDQDRNGHNASTGDPWKWPFG